MTKTYPLHHKLMPELTPELANKHADAALKWILKSIEATKGMGSSHHYMPVWGWAAAYPETTGYLIETLLDYAELRADEHLRKVAFSCADWLCAIQLENGAFAGNTVGNTHPSVFNTAQILFGLSRAALVAKGEQQREKYEKAVLAAVKWMLQIMEPDGSWRTAAFVPGYVPSYYTRALMGLLFAANTLPYYAGKEIYQDEIKEKARLALTFYAHCFLPNGAIKDWGFHPGATAFTHTLAYTLEGFWHCSKWLNAPEILSKIQYSADILLAVRDKAGKTAGRYNDRWEGDYTFICPTGHAQLSILYHDMGLHTGEKHYTAASKAFLQEILPYQTAAGALPGSVPFWGPYMRFRYPNWSVKFLLDALKNVRNGAFTTNQ